LTEFSTYTVGGAMTSSNAESLD